MWNHHIHLQWFWGFPHDAKVGAVTARPRFVLFWTQPGTCFVGETLGTDVGGTKAVANIKHHKSMEGVFK